MIDLKHFPSNCLEEMAVDLSKGYQWVPATIIAGGHHPHVEGSLPLLIADVTDSGLLTTVVKVLGNAYPTTHPLLLTIPNEDGDPRTTTLAQLAHAGPGQYPCALLLPPLPPGSSFSELQAVVAHLRAPDGCPWDREQTLASLRQDLLSEAVEVLEAIDLEQSGLDNSQHIAEELGDTMMLATLMIQIAIDEERFRMADVMQHIVEKLIRRHPHVFADIQIDSLDDIVVNWDAIKVEEKIQKGATPKGPLDGVPASLPALEKARTLQSKASKAGLLDRQQLAATAGPRAARLGDGASLGATELGGLLWALVALAHDQGINAEDALRSYAVAFRAGLIAQPDAPEA